MARWVHVAASLTGDVVTVDVVRRGMFGRALEARRYRGVGPTGTFFDVDTGDKAPADALKTLYDAEAGLRKPIEQTPKKLDIRDDPIGYLMMRAAEYRRQIDNSGGARELAARYEIAAARLAAEEKE
jgi:hypothetical protein